MPKHSIQDDPLPYAFQQPDLPRLRLCLPFGASGTCACDRYPFYRALSIMSYNRIWRSKQDSNLQLLFGAPAFQAGRLPLSHCCIGSGSWVRTNNPLGQNQVLFQLSYAAIWAQAEQGSPARANRGKEENNMARFRGWRQRRASNPQARRPPVFRTDWHSHLPSLPYWKSWTPCAPLYLYYMHFLRFIF